jgi:hypothetical protein
MTRICEESREFSLSLMIKICFLLELSGIHLVNRGLLVLAMAIVTKHNSSVRRISSRRKCDPAPPRDVGAVALFAINNGLRFSTPHLAAVGGSILQGLCEN